MRKDLSGKRFGRLEAIRRVGFDSRQSSLWECRCDCGNIAIVRINSLTTGNTKSCGCYMKDVVSSMTIKRNTTHGKSRSRTYRIWNKIKERCQDHNNKSYENYGARGIKICDRWRKYENFIADMGECPEGLTIERIDNDKGYFPNNCKWATRKEQNNNTRANRILEFKGQRKTLAQWSELVGINYKTIHTRLSNGWPIEKALNG